MNQNIVNKTPGFIVLTFFLILSGLISACKGKDLTLPALPNNPAVDRDTISITGDLTYMALGDSYTIGQNVTEPARYPVQAATMLIAMGIKVNNPDIIAITGWTTKDLLNGIASAKPKTDYDIVSLLIGVNDQYQEHDTIGYQEHFTACLIKAIALANGKSKHVVVLSIPDYSVTPFGSGIGAALIAKQIDQFNEINKSVTAAYGITYIDVTTTSRQVKDDPEMLSSDGLHPSGKQYRLWAEMLASAIRLKLN